ncbi:hypothetical protein RI103_13980 [Paraburkholderia sp. FT54]|uniref:hypothetical protein n=1 Tax=Paraburkholderia sp. FT54 TaxID=3074437 RepID=UPI0028777618|nr:hypothetical protein [Paraburkholderia sp. FT54]WNC88809.1 hypothetical protein RI103_13980 [Paraburkholderia sp. FT54]
MAEFLGVPDVIWSGVVASCITLGGVWLSNRGNTDRLVKQFGHDEREKARQRKADLRRDVYLEFVAEFSTANAHTGKLPEIDIASVNPAAGIQPFLALAAKVQLICTNESVNAITQVMAAFMSLFTRASVKALPIQNLAAEIRSINAVYEDSQTEIKRLLSAMRSFTEAVKTDDIAFGVLSRSFKQQQEFAKSLADKRADLSNKKNELHADYLKFTVAELSPIIDLVVPASVALRRELEVDDDGDDFEIQARKRANIMKDQVQSVINEFLADIRTHSDA